tara:strand:+ start:13358 stop:13675 length:318 start_codon:yes stop_codon:yes gene_type:complete
MKTFWMIILIAVALTAVSFGSLVLRMSVGGAIISGEPAVLLYGVPVFIIIILIAVFATSMYQKHEWKNDVFYLLFKNFLKVLGFVGNGYEKMKSQLRKNINEDKK